MKNKKIKTNKQIIKSIHVLRFKYKINTFHPIHLKIKSVHKKG